MSWMKKAIAMVLGICAAGGVFPQAKPYIAGLEPATRPAGAPVITKFEQTPAWQAQALKGIAEPRVGLGFLKDQGAWYTPFSRPNQTGLYDIRGMYSDAAKKD
jgi:hypothetical protein